MPAIVSKNGSPVAQSGFLAAGGVGYAFEVADIAEDEGCAETASAGITGVCADDDDCSEEVGSEKAAGLALRLSPVMVLLTWPA